MNRKVSYVIALALSIALVSNAVAAAQQKTELINELTFVNAGQKWSDAQSEVWKVVQAYWHVDTVEEQMDFYHTDYMGWSTLDPMPIDKPTCRLQLTNLFSTRKPHITTIAPAGMKLYGNVAVACYYYMTLYSDTDGKQHAEQGRWTDVLMKQDGKWLLIADHGGPSASEDD